jgi:glycosyltransferase involved in cell wall biosynthesis
MARTQRPAQAFQPKDLGDALTALAAMVAPIVTFALLVNYLGWGTGLAVGWLVAPLSAPVAAALVLIWTIPLRPEASLSLRRRPRVRVLRDEPELATRRSISVVAPAFNAETYLRLSLPPLMDMVRQGQVREVIVVDDGSTDGSADFARSLGATVIPSGGRRGPGGARNIAAQMSKSEILWFVDADVVIHPGCAMYVLRAFDRPGVVAMFGSYDDHPAAPNFGSQYKNLVHHHYHQNASMEASTFWSGCGAVNREAFLDVGGFDEAKYTRPSIEDVDLGYRLRQAGGRITLDRRLQSTHLKVWSVPELVRVDIFRRALPWSRLMLRMDEVLDDLNVGTGERLRAAYAGFTVLAIAVVATGLISPWWLLPVLLTNLSANWHIFKLFVARRGLLFGVAALAFHQFYYLYSAAAFVFCWAENKLQRLKAASYPKAALSRE